MIQPSYYNLSNAISSTFLYEFLIETVMAETFVALIAALIISGIFVSVGFTAAGSIIQGPMLLGGFVGVAASAVGIFKKITGS